MTRFILDAGHGGMAFGEYLTLGKQSPDVPPGIYEGEFNRYVCRNLVYQLHRLGYRALELCPGPINVPLARSKRQKANKLTTRVDAVNHLAKTYSDLFLVSIHANASGNDWDHTAWGAKVFLPRRKGYHVPSDIRACEQYAAEKILAGLKKLTRSRGISRAGFTIIQRVRCPAILVEVDFMTHPKQAQMLSYWWFRNRVVGEIANALHALGQYQGKKHREE